MSACAYSPSGRHEYREIVCMWCGDAAPVTPHTGQQWLRSGEPLGRHTQSPCGGRVVVTNEGDGRCRACGRRFTLAAIVRYEEVQP